MGKTAFPVVFILFYSVEQGVISKKEGNSTAKFFAGPLALTPDPGQQKQRAACVSISFLRKGPNVNPKVQNLQLKVSAAALPTQMHG